MPKRIVVNLKPGARPCLQAVSDRLTREADMRVGLAFPRHGLIVGEVQGQTEVDRIMTMEEVEGVRVHAETGKPRRGRSGGSSLH